MIISGRVKVQLLVFALLSVLGIAYVGATYIGLHPFSSPYTIRAFFTDSGGIFPSANVTVRGVSVGKVHALKITPTGVEVDLQIDPGQKIPKDSTAKVADLSAVGEQYVDITPKTDSAPYFADGDEIPDSRTSIPVPPAQLISNLDALVNSVNRQQLATVISELGKAFTNTGPALQSIIDKGNALTEAAQQNLPDTVKLLDDGKTVLDTQRAVADELRTFAAHLRSFSGQLVTSDPDLRRVLDNGVTGAQEVTSLLQENRTALPILLHNLVDLASIQAARLPGLATILALYPANVANGFFAAAPVPGISGDQAIAHFGLVLTQSPKLCDNGYLPADKRAKDNSKPGAAQPFLDYFCLPPQPGQDPSTAQATASNPNGTTARGAYNAPRPPGDDTGVPPYRSGSGGAASPSATSSGTAAGSGSGASTGASVTPTPYDPSTGLLTGPDGKLYELGSNGGQQQLFGDASWEWLLIGPLSG